MKPRFTGQQIIGALSQPSEPSQNGFCESINARLRDECLNKSLFSSHRESFEIIEALRNPFSKIVRIQPCDSARRMNLLDAVWSIPQTA